MSMTGHWAIALHGGAGVISRVTARLPYEQALTLAVDAACDVLHTGAGSDAAIPWDEANVPFPPKAVSAALAAVEAMEACPLFNAGRGAVLNNRAFVENEASVMDGATLKTGATCGLRTVVHPARLAAIIYATADFQFLGFSAAERYAAKFPSLIQKKEPTWFVTDRRKANLNNARLRRATFLDHTGGTVRRGVPESSPAERGASTGGGNRNDEGETVGATVCDGKGNVACVTSTGGVTNKWEGRIGDTPLIGAGSYASNSSCAVSGTGWGEQFIRYSAASRVCFAVEYGGMSVKDAVYDVVHKVFPEKTGGFVAVTPEGEVIMDFNSLGMFRACRNWQGQDLVKIWD